MATKDEDRQSQQRRTFLNFCNHSLSRYDRSVNSLADLSTGVELFFLLRAIYERNGREFPIFNKLETKRTEFAVVQKVNVKNIIDFLRDVEKLNLVGINPSSIIEKDLKVIMGLLWQIISHYLSQQSNEKDVDDQNESNKEKKNITSFYSTMVGFVNNLIADETLKIQQTDDWKTGKAIFCLIEAILHKHDLDLNEKKRSEFLEQNRNIEGPELIKNCIDFAHEEFSVPRLLTEEDFEYPDEMSIAIFLTYFRSFYYQENGKDQQKLEEEEEEEEENKQNEFEKYEMEKNRLEEVIHQKDVEIEKLRFEKLETEKIASLKEEETVSKENSELESKLDEMSKLYIKGKKRKEEENQKMIEDEKVKAQKMQNELESKLNDSTNRSSELETQLEKAKKKSFKIVNETGEYQKKVQEWKRIYEEKYQKLEEENENLKTQIQQQQQQLSMISEGSLSSSVSSAPKVIKKLKKEEVDSVLDDRKNGILARPITIRTNSRDKGFFGTLFMC